MRKITFNKVQDEYFKIKKKYMFAKRDLDIDLVLKLKEQMKELTLLGNFCKYPGKTYDTQIVIDLIEKYDYLRMN